MDDTFLHVFGRGLSDRHGLWYAFLPVSSVNSSKRFPSQPIESRRSLTHTGWQTHDYHRARAERPPFHR